VADTPATALTGEQLDELAALAERMTPAPWRWGDHRKTSFSGAQESMFKLYRVKDNGLSGPPVLALEPTSCYTTMADDTDGIVALRNAAPALLSMVRSQSERIRELEEGLRDALAGWTRDARDPFGTSDDDEAYEPGFEIRRRLRALAGGAAARTTETPGGKP
jgi:hypothetical protein